MHRREFIKLAVSSILFSAAAKAGLVTNRVWAESPSIYDLVIIGGGLSGLTAANAMKSHNILVLEKEAGMDA